MGTLTQPSNFNFFAHDGFRFTLTRAPNAMFFVSRASVPGFTAEGPRLPTPFIDIQLVPDKGTFNQLSVSFMLDEDFAVFFEMHNWLVPMAYPSNFDEHAALQNIPRTQDNGLYSDGTLTLLTSKNNGNIEFTFRNMLPVSFGDIDLTVQDDGTNYATFDVQFAYERYTVRRI